MWLEPETDIYYCLDGFHRIKALKELEEDGATILDKLPATIIECVDKQEAARLVLIYTSIYAKITQQGLFDFLHLYDLEYNAIREQMDLPEFSTDRFDKI